MPKALRRTTLQLFGSPFERKNQNSRFSGCSNSAIAPNADRSITSIISRSLSASLGGRGRSVGNQPPNPCRLGLIPNSFFNQRNGSLWRQFSRRSKYCLMFAARQLESPVNSAIESQSELWGNTKIIALCAVQPPSVPARG